MRKFLKSTYAATAIEFAIVLPVLLLLLLGIIQFGLTLFVDSSLNTGIRAVAREGTALGYSPDATGQDQINAIMKANLGGLYDPTQASFRIFTFANFKDPYFCCGAASVKTLFLANPLNIFDTLGKPVSIPPSNLQSGRIILYAVRYKWGSTFGIRNPFLPTSLYSFAIVRNEDFSNGNPTAIGH